MENPMLQKVESALLAPSNLSEKDIQQWLGRLLVTGVDEADLYFQYVEQEAFSLDDGIVKSGSFQIDQGVGVRAVSGEKTGYAYTDDLTPDALSQATTAARSIVQAGQSASVPILSTPTVPSRYAPCQPIEAMKREEKIALLRRIDALARATSERVIQVMSSLVATYEVVLIVTQAGRWVPDVRPLVRLNISVIVEQGDRRETGSIGGGGRVTFETFLKSHPVEEMVKEAVRIAEVNLEARPAPAGTFPVVLGPGWPGILLHEAVGHGLEGDFNRKGSSVFSGRVGEQVASPLCTVVDDGTLMDRRGSLTVDDEGTPSQENVLIENGVLKGYLQDRMNARLMNTSPTGNGRRESYACAPMPRMTNTFMRNGPHDPEEILASVDDGVYAVNFGGGQVDITSGKFVFSTSEAYRIEKGKITYPIKGATLIGSGPEVMTKISMLGNDLTLDDGIGTCGKDGQSVPVGVGQPTTKVDAITVGGTDHG